MRYGFWHSRSPKQGGLNYNERLLFAPRHVRKFYPLPLLVQVLSSRHFNTRKESAQVAGSCTGSRWSFPLDVACEAAGLLIPPPATGTQTAGPRGARCGFTCRSWVWGFVPVSSLVFTATTAAYIPAISPATLVHLCRAAFAHQAVAGSWAGSWAGSSRATPKPPFSSTARAASSRAMSSSTRSIPPPPLPSFPRVPLYMD